MNTKYLLTEENGVLNGGEMIQSIRILLEQSIVIPESLLYVNRTMIIIDYHHHHHHHHHYHHH